MTMYRHLGGTAAETVSGVVKAAPAVSVSAASALGANLQNWVYVVTIVYIVLQSTFLIYRWVRSHRKHKRERRNADSD